MGALTVIEDVSGSITRGSGTSFSAPIIAGMTACLMQSKPGYANTFIKTAIQRSASHASTPDSLTGFGIPDFSKAMNLMGINAITESNSLSIFPNPVSSEFTLSFRASGAGIQTLKLVDEMGRIIRVSTIQVVEGKNSLVINYMAGLKPGIYFIILDSDSHHSGTRLVKLPD